MSVFTVPILHVVLHLALLESIVTAWKKATKCTSQCFYKFYKHVWVNNNSGHAVWTVPLKALDTGAG